MARWDRRSPGQQAKFQDAALARQVSENLAPFSPYWARVVRPTGIRAEQVTRVSDLAAVPVLGERDLCPDGDPAGAAQLVLHVTEAGYARHTGGPALRRALRRRLTRPAAYARQVQDAVRPVTYHLGGLAVPLPIASTREDLDVIARAGARAWAVLGLTADDLLVSALPPDGALTAMALPYAALGAGAPGVHAGLEAAAEALAVMPATVVAVADADALDALGRLPSTVHTVLVTTDDTDVAALAEHARVLRVWGPPDGRWLYAECRQGGRSAGLHTYPDLEVLETVDPASGESAPSGELVITQLGVRGSALLRWRTGAVHEGLLSGACPSCGRTVPRIGPEVRPGALVEQALVEGELVALDLRAAAGALAGRPDITGWRIRVQPEPGTTTSSVVVAISPTGRPRQAAAAAYADIQAVAGVGPSQVLIEEGFTDGAIDLTP